MSDLIKKVDIEELKHDLDRIRMYGKADSVRERVERALNELIEYRKDNYYKVGDKIKFKEEKQRYTVRATDGRFAICTKPFNLQKTVLYCIVDFEEQVRGTENLVFGMGAETDEQCEDMLKRLNEKEDPSEISYRNRTPLRIDG